MPTDGVAAGVGYAAVCPFGSLSISGGIVNAYNALKMADEVSAGKARP